MATSSDLCREFDQRHGHSTVTQFVRSQWDRPITTYDDAARFANSSFKHEKDPSWARSHSRFNALGPILQCPPTLLSAFGSGDEEKRVCGSFTRGRGREQASAASNCVVVSLGSDNLYGFEAAIVRRRPWCRIHVFDCTVVPRVPPALAARVNFHSICIGTKDEVVRKRRFMSWTSIVSYLRLTAPPDVLKMDIEGFEWDVLPALASSPALLPATISLELHYLTQMRDIKWYGRLRTPPEIAAWMDFMFTRGGYVLVDRRDNSRCLHCSEIVIARLAPCVARPATSQNSSAIWAGRAASPFTELEDGVDAAAARHVVYGAFLGIGLGGVLRWMVKRRRSSTFFG